MRGQKFRFDTINHKFILRADIAMLFIQALISIVYLGSWITFLVVRIPRVLWGSIMAILRVKILQSGSARCMLNSDWVLRLVTLLF